MKSGLDVCKKAEARYCVLGGLALDLQVSADKTAFRDHRVEFMVGSDCFSIPYRGKPIKWGEKREALGDLGALRNLEGVSVVNGGGGRNTATHLAKVITERRLPIQIVAVDASKTWDELEREYSALGIVRISLRLEGIPANVVLTDGTTERLILKSPLVPAELTNEQVEKLFRLLSKDAAVVMINSPKSVDLARVVVEAAQAAGASQYSVITPSLPVSDRIEMLLARDQASVCNLSEFSLIAEAVGVDAPTDEDTASLEDIARAMVRVARICETGDLVVTLGAKGCMVGDRATGTLCHIGLHLSRWHEVQDNLRLHPGRKNGAGDSFFGSFTLAHAGHAGPKKPILASEAALEASIDIVRQLVPALHPDPSWFVLRTLPYVFDGRCG